MRQDRLNSAKHCLLVFLVLGLLALFFLFQPIQLAHAAPKANLSITVDTSTDSNAAGFQVCSALPGDCSLRGAISKANGDTGNLYTVILPAGTYSLTIPGTDEHNNADGDLDIRTSLVISGASASNTIVNGSGGAGERVFHIIGAFSVMITGVQITGGSGNFTGLGINNEGGSLSILDSTITANVSGSGAGGGIGNFGGPLTVTNSTISSNVVGAAGGGIYNGGTMLLVSSVISGNSAPANYGGGIYNSGDVTITGSTLRGNFTSNFGGGIFNDGGSVMINSGAVITGNTASGGGAGIGSSQFIASTTPKLTVSNSTIAMNTTGNSSASGAGIYNSGDMTLSASNVLTNQANVGGSHGGILSTGTITITQSTISGNYSGNPGDDGAGITNTGGGTMSVISSTISNNTSDGGGGGISNVISSVAVITGSTISGNQANDTTNGDGGGIRNSGTLTITNSTITDNGAATNGGGLYSATGIVDLNNVTITNNRADDDNSGTGNGGGTQGSMNLRNTIIAGNIDKGNERPDCTGALTSLGYNLIGKSDGCSFLPTTGDQQGSIASPLDPKLGALASNGGATQTHALLPGSPAINAGTNTGCPSTDQRGVARPIAGTCDIGAYEAQATIFLPLIKR